MINTGGSFFFSFFFFFFFTFNYRDPKMGRNHFAKGVLILSGFQKLSAPSKGPTFNRV